MSVDRLVRVNELLKREIGLSLYRVITEGGFDLAAVTITKVSVSKDLANARVQVSIRANDEQREQMLERLRYHRGDIQKLVGSVVVLKRTPRLHFEIDTSIEEGDRVLQLLTKLAPVPDAGASDEAALDATWDPSKEDK